MRGGGAVVADNVFEACFVEGEVGAAYCEEAFEFFGEGRCLGEEGGWSEGCWEGCERGVYVVCLEGGWFWG